MNKNMNSSDLTSVIVKSLASESGADLCGIAHVGRFSDAPEGFHPADIFSGTRSVIAIARRIPAGVFKSNSRIPYTFADDVALQEIFRITYDLTLKLEDCGVTAVPVPSDPYESWDSDKMEGRGLLSLKHAAVLSGLGVMGRNRLLTNNRYGNLLKLGLVLTDAVLDSDPVAEYSFCRDSCNLCIKNCPVGAISESGVDQKKCRMNSEGVTAKGDPVYTCWKCRTVCPFIDGIKYA
ncbi:MAG TPA: epoxyqueuosine reductase [Spirochaetota bacterium]|nr:epoxyqueuosine reductase [Spirochaetota bacterium]HPJ35245.1 epoxyqueuosine reductase [Spirochaetota bacterium]